MAAGGGSRCSGEGAGAGSDAQGGRAKEGAQPAACGDDRVRLEALERSIQGLQQLQQWHASLLEDAREQISALLAGRQT